jgi:hypothetical protein
LHQFDDLAAFTTGKIARVSSEKPPDDLVVPLHFYTFTTYMQKYLVNTAHMDASTREAESAATRRPLHTAS